MKEEKFVLTLYKAVDMDALYGFLRFLKEEIAMEFSLSRNWEDNTVVIESDEFPVDIIKLVFGNCHENGFVSGSSYYIVANPRIAVTNNQETYRANNNQSYYEMQYYLLELNKTFSTEYKFKDFLKQDGKDASEYHILTMQHFYGGHVPDSISPSELWTPFDDPYFFHSSDPRKQRENENLFAKLLEIRGGYKNKHYKDLLVKITTGDFNKTFVCSDIEGNPILMDPSKISSIKPVDTVGEKLMAYVNFVGNSPITVDLQEFVKDFVGFHDNESTSLPEYAIEPNCCSDSIAVNEKSWQWYDDILQQYQKYCDKS